MKTGKAISTDDSVYWDYLKDIEDSAFDGNKRNEDHTYFTKFALGLNLKDQSKDIIDTFQCWLNQYWRGSMWEKCSN